jgi:hypothetical protein
MIVVIVPWSAALIVPIVILEGWILGRRLNLPARRVMLATWLANLASTFLGVPLTWFALALLWGYAHVGLLGFTWLSDGDWWTIPRAALAHMPLFFCISWWSEYLVSRRLLRDVEKVPLRRAVMWANLASYGLLVAFLLAVIAAAPATGTP